MRNRLSAACLGVVLSVAMVWADDLSVQVDPKANFSAFKTFAIRVTKIESDRPELDNPLFIKKLSATIRDVLLQKGLKPTNGRPDLLVDYTLTNEDISTSQRGMVRGAGPQPLRFTQGTLVIDLTRPGDTTPVYRGTYRDDESTGSKLMQKLPEDARKLLAKYPALSGVHDPS